MKPLSEYHKGGVRKDGTHRPAAACRDCKAEQTRQNKYRRRAEDLESWRKARAKQYKRAREQDPEKYRAYSRKSYEKRKQDPVVYREYLDRHRMNYRLRQERNGRSIEDLRQYRPGRQPDPYLDGAPLRGWIDRKVEQYGGTAALAKRLECDEAALRFRGQERVRLSKVDRMLTLEGSTLLHDLYPEFC